MLVKNENEWCWCFDEYVGYPQKSITDAVNDFAKTYPDDEVPKIRVANPYYYIPTVDAECVIENVFDSDLDDEIAEYSEDYLLNVKQEHIDELLNILEIRAEIENIRGLDDDNHKLKSDYEIAKNGRFA